MAMTAAPDTPPALRMRSYIQRIATGPELSKDLDEDEARDGMRLILEGRIDPVQAGIFLIALRMKRETEAENRGVQSALLEATKQVRAEVDDVVDIADPFDGFTRGLPAAAFLGPVLAACGVAAITNGAESVGPKFGVTHRRVLERAGADVDLEPGEAAARLSEPAVGWAYLDQRHGCPALHALVGLRTLIVKRPCITTIEVVLGPVRGKRRTHLMTGYVHKPYPPIYTMLARHSGYDSAMIVRGVEGGVIPSLSQPSRLVRYWQAGGDEDWRLEPGDAGIDRAERAVPLPPDLPAPGDGTAAAIDVDAVAEAAARAGRAALEGESGPFRDSLVYGAAICLRHLGREPDLGSAAGRARRAIDDGSALARLLAAA
jgi:anthranilate phosphoribosyltransferase